MDWKLTKKEKKGNATKQGENCFTYSICNFIPSFYVNCIKCIRTKLKMSNIETDNIDDIYRVWM